MKGRGNYLCRKKLYDLTDQPMLNGLDEINHFRIISDWEKTTETGDRAELAALPETSRAVAQAGRPHRSLHRPEVPAVRPLLHHRDASARRRERHHHRQPSPVLRRPGDQGGSRSRARCRRAARRRGRHLRRSARAGRGGQQITSASRVCNLRVDDLLRDVERRCAAPTFAVADVLCGVAPACASARSFSSRCFRPGEGRFAFENRAEFLEENGDEYLGAAECADAPLHRAAGHSQEAGRGARPGAPGGRVAQAAGFHSGGAGPQHRLLDRARAERPARRRRTAQRLSAGDADRRVGHPAHDAVRASGDRRC